MDKGAWQATVHRVTKSWTQLKQISTHTPLSLSSVLLNSALYCLCRIQGLSNLNQTSQEISRIIDTICQITSSLFQSRLTFLSTASKERPTIQRKQVVVVVFKGQMFCSFKQIIQLIFNYSLKSHSICLAQSRVKQELLNRIKIVLIWRLHVKISRRSHL